MFDADLDELAAELELPAASPAWALASSRHGSREMGYELGFWEWVARESNPEPTD
jgi:hypothetical protein